VEVCRPAGTASISVAWAASTVGKMLRKRIKRDDRFIRFTDKGPVDL